MIERPRKIFPCDCMGEGLVARVEKETRDCEGAPFLEIGYWLYGHEGDKLSWREVLRTCWHIIRKRSLWVDMLTMKASIAKNFAHHILYLIDKEKKNRELPKPLVEEEKMIDQEAKILSLEDLRNTIWDYKENDLIGLYKDTFIRRYLFEVKTFNSEEDNDRNLLTVQSCNVIEGWIEFIEFEGNPVLNSDGKIISPGKPKIENDKIVKTRIKCSTIVVDILDVKGNVIETIF